MNKKEPSAEEEKVAEAGKKKAKTSKTTEASAEKVKKTKTSKTTEASAEKAKKTKTTEASTEKAKKTKTVVVEEVEDTSFKAKAIALAKTKNFRIGAIAGLAVILILCLVLGLVFGLRSCMGMNGILRKDAVIVNSYAQTTKVGYSAQTLGTVSRNKPISGVYDERDAFPLGISVADDARYPKYGYTMSSVIGTTDDKVHARDQLIYESAYLCAYGTAGANSGGALTADKYTKIDENGWLYQYRDADGDGVSEWVHSLKWGTSDYTASNYRRLYQHTASIGMYLGDVSDSEPGIVKQVTLRNRGYSSYSVTGVYAPAGEVVKIQLSGADMDATGGISVHIGQALYNGQANNIWTSKNQMQRFPLILNTLVINKTTAEYDEATDTWTGYIGSFVGGPVYIRNTSATFTVTISGGVAYRHFILGYTTAEEYAELCKSTAPYFDLEVWEYGVLHSGPVSYASGFSYEDLYKAGVLWEKVSLVTTTNGTKQGIVFLYDPFVAAGAAVAFPGRSSVNCPMGWMTSSLNYSSIVTSGSWGNFHEYHHNFQNYGVTGSNGEVTNNGLNLVAYSLFTNISSARQISGYGGAGLSGWNQYTSATWTLNRVNTGEITSTNGLAIYATLLHNFGQDAFINARGSTGTNNYLDKWASVTHQDFTYYASRITAFGTGTYSPSDAVKEANYPLFVPVASVYQTGRTYNYDGEKREINTMQPYVIPYGVPFTVDLNPYHEEDGQYASGSVVIGTGFKYTVKRVTTAGINGAIFKTGEGIYTFIPNSEMRSGKIYVTLEITTADGAHEWNGHALEDVDLILEFQQSHEWNKAILERTTYVYSEGNVPASATEAYESGYSGYISVTAEDNKNKSQNSNTDIWLYPYERYKDDESLSDYLMIPNSVMELKGKLYFPEEGKYRIYLRGRQDCVLYISRDGGKTYEKVAYIDKSINKDDSPSFFPDDARTYVDVDVKAEEWIYFKEVVIIKDLGGKASFVGLGIGSWTVPQYSTTVDANGVTHYYDTDGHEVDADKASDVTPIPPKSVSYATAYRQDYEFQKEFESDYFYVRTYTYDYTNNVSVPVDEVELVDSNYTAPPANWGWGVFPVENLTDGKTNTYIHTSWAVTESKPLNLTFDLGSEKTINRITFFCRNNNGMLETPKAFTVEGSLDGEIWFDVAVFTEAPRNGQYVIVDFDDVTMRYCRISISQTHQGSGSYYVVIGEITFTHSEEIMGATQYTPDNEMFTYKGDWKVESCSSNFGHVFVGEDATVEFEFEGTRFGIIASKYFGQNYEVYVDGERVESANLKEDSGDYVLAYLTPELEEGKHSVIIYMSKEGNIDSITVWQNLD